MTATMYTVNARDLIGAGGSGLGVPVSAEYRDFRSRRAGPDGSHPFFYRLDCLAAAAAAAGAGRTGETDLEMASSGRDEWQRRQMCLSVSVCARLKRVDDKSRSPSSIVDGQFTSNWASGERLGRWLTPLGWLTTVPQLANKSSDA